MNQATFQRDYPGVKAILDEIVFPVFGESTILCEDVIANNALQDKSKSAGITKIFRIAAYTLDGTPFNIFDVEIGKNIDISRNRVNIKRLLVSQSDVFSSSLIFFHYADSEKEWRISYFAKGGGNGEVTASKRYTFLCGSNHACRTVKDRFELLAQASNTLKSVQDTFSVEELNKDFYRKLSNWFFWAMNEVSFPEGTNDSSLNAVPLIRLITRTIFVWFMRKKGLIPDQLFEKSFIDSILRPDFDTSSYYKAILQNLFFATLNTEQTDSNARKFIEPKTYHGANKHYHIYSLYRYEDFFTANGKTDFLKTVRNIPFLNGGLFACLDDNEEGMTIDAFSDNHLNHRKLLVPNKLFWMTEEENCIVDLSKVYGDDRRNREKVLGLIPLLSQYNFTMDESSRDESTVALDPELLGMVFENLLASYNPETSISARKQTGSFYTPREIVDYMVEECLIRYLLRTTQELGMDETQIRTIVTADQQPNLPAEQKQAVVKAIQNCKILDPACGSGGFPMGLLLNLVRVLEKLDPVGSHIELYERKLHLIKNCIYGVDIQQIAVQISKLRCFISLLAECEPDQTAKNCGIEPLPNLEMHFITANSLLDVDLSVFDEWTTDPEIKRLTSELSDIRSRFFSVKRHEQKKSLRSADKAKRGELKEKLASLATKGNEQKISMLTREIAKLENERKKCLEEKWEDVANPETDTLFDFAKPDASDSLFRVDVNAEKRNKIDAGLKKCRRDLAREQSLELDKIQLEAAKLADWDPFNQMATAPYFNHKWMFGETNDFDMIIGNPPYIQLQKDRGKLAELYKSCNFDTFAKTGDIYCLFYERGYQLLQDAGILCFITSNKWMRAGYGEAIRKFLAERTNPVNLIDFAGQKIFESATVDTNILIFEKNIKNAGKTSACVAKVGCRNNLSGFVRQNACQCAFTSADSWVILNPIEQSIKRKIEAIGTPLKDWDIKINYGIKTGYNDAFIISGEKREEILTTCKDAEERKRTAELIRPILRGRDIKRYSYDFANIYIIASHNGIPARGIPRIHIEDYPAIKRHLDAFWNQISKRSDMGDTPYNLRSCAYMDDFNKQKIIWGEISDKTKFALDTHGDFYAEATTFLMTGEWLTFLTCFLNSLLSEYLFSKIGTTTGVGTVRWKKFKIEQLYVPKINDFIEREFAEIINAEDTNLISEIVNQKIYQLCALSDEEISFIQEFMTKYR